MPWDDDRLDAVEREARACTSGDACTVDVLALIAEVRRLRTALRLSEASRGVPAYNDAGIRYRDGGPPSVVD